MYFDSSHGAWQHCCTTRKCRTCCRPVGVPPGEAVASLNASYLGANEGALNMTRTSSASLLRLRGKATKQFVLKPGHLDFGTVKVGQASFRFFSSVPCSNQEYVHAARVVYSVEQEHMASAGSLVHGL